jgi:hypothetical protein
MFVANGVWRRLVALTISACVVVYSQQGLATAPALDSPRPVPVFVPTVELRLVAWAAAGVEVAGSFWDHRLRAELGGRWVVWDARTFFIEAAGLTRVVGPADHALWIRAGYLRQSIATGCVVPQTAVSVDRADSFDLGLSYRHRWARGHLLATELGLEYLKRDQGFYCNDSVLPGAGGGVRTAVMGQLAVWRRLSLTAKVGVRTAPHILEIGLLPDVSLGVAFEF